MPTHSVNAHISYESKVSDMCTLIALAAINNPKEIQKFNTSNLFLDGCCQGVDICLSSPLRWILPKRWRWSHPY